MQRIKQYMDRALRQHFYVLLVMLVVAGGCEERRAPHIVLRVEDPVPLADGATQIAFGRDLEDLRTLDLVGKILPASFTLVAKSAGESMLWVRALDSNASVLAQGAVEVNFRRQQKDTFVVKLFSTCTGQAEDNGVTCIPDDAPEETQARCLQGICQVPSCGDGVLCVDSAYCNSLGTSDAAFVAEECDDDNTDDTDACLNSCLEARCGDGVTRTDLNAQEDGFEECDDGNTDNTDGCLNTCLQARCGDGVLQTGVEVCDDSNNNNNDGCAGCALSQWETQSLVIGQAANIVAPSAMVLRHVAGMAADLDGNLYFSDKEKHQVWKWQPAQGTTAATLVPIAGTGYAGYDADVDTGLALQMQLNEPGSIEIDALRNLYVADVGNDCIRKITSSGMMSTLAGQCGTQTGDISADFIGSATAARLEAIHDIFLGSDNTLYVLHGSAVEDLLGGLEPFILLRAIDLESGQIETVFDLVAEDNDFKTAFCLELFCAQFVFSSNIDFVVHEGDRKTLVFTDQGVLNGNPGIHQYAEQANGEWVWSVLAGNPLGVGPQAMCKPASAILPECASNASGEICTCLDADDNDICDYCADSGQDALCDYCQDGDALDGLLNAPMDILLNDADELVFAEQGTYRVRVLDWLSAEPQLKTILGGLTPCVSVDECGFDGLASAATFSAPRALAQDQSGNLYISDIGLGVILQHNAEGSVTVIVGGGETESAQASNTEPLHTRLDGPEDAVFSSINELYFVDTQNHLVRKLNTDGAIENVVGTGVACVNPAALLKPCGDGGPAINAQLNTPTSIAFDSEGSLYIADAGSFRIRKVSQVSQTISTLVGNGQMCPAEVPEVGEECLAGLAQSNFSNARLNAPRALAFDAQDNLYFTEPDRHLIFRINKASDSDDYADIERLNAETCTAAGTPETGAYTLCDAGDPEDATLGEIRFDTPMDLVFDAQGNLFVADTINYLVRKIAVPTACTENCIPSVTASKVIHLAGIRPVGEPEVTVPCEESDVTCGDGLAAAEAKLREPRGLSINDEGLIFVADGAMVRQFSPGGVITRSAGNGVSTTSSEKIGDFGEPESATFATVEAVVWRDGTGSEDLASVFAVDSDTNRIREITLGDTPSIQTVVGEVYPQGDGVLSVARLGAPQDIALISSDASKDVWWISDSLEERVRSLTLYKDGSGDEDALTTVVGYAGGFGQSDELYDSDTPDNNFVAAEKARMFFGAGPLVYDSITDAVYVAEAQGHTLRCIHVPIEGDHVVSTVAGVYGQPGYEADPESVLETHFNNPTGLALDEITRTLYVADSGNHIVRSIALSMLGTPCVFAVEAGFNLVAGQPETLGMIFDDGALASDSYFNTPTGLVTASDGSVYVADSQNHRVRRLYYDGASQVIETVMGNGFPGEGGEGSPASVFRLDSPQGLALDTYGNLYIASAASIRQVGAGVDGVARGSDTTVYVYGAPPRINMPENISLCVRGLAFASQDFVDDTLFFTDGCTGLLGQVMHKVIDSEDGSE
jgi:cysteine-rich repeat protein